MPKKISTNPKAQAARERKLEQKQQENAQREKQKEDALWADDDKQLAKKQQRKDQKEKKRLEDLQKKQEKRDLLDAETASIPGRNAALPKKVTRASIEEEKVRKAKQREREEKLNAKKEDETFIDENPNQRMAQLLAEQGGIEARNIDEAIDVLSINEKKVDRHPEKRMKAAYAEFESRELPILKAEHDNLRLSQLKQMLRKRWQSSPENPLNQL